MTAPHRLVDALVTKSSLRSTMAEIVALLLELAEMDDESIDEGDPALLGSFRDEANALIGRVKAEVDAR